MEIVWTELSIKSLSELLLFVHNRWGNKKSIDVRKLIQHDVSLLEQNPYLGKVMPESESLSIKIRSLIIKRKNKVFYQLKGEKIYILLVWDTRKDPETLRKVLQLFFTE